MARVLYFATLVDKLGLDSEDVDLPPQVTNVRTLLLWLRTRGGAWSGLADDAVRVTVNRQFATLNTPVTNEAEIALVPMRR